MPMAISRVKMWKVIIVFTAIKLSEACLSSGACGSSCAPAPAASCAPSSCQPGYSCGPYGCARNRARSALTKKFEGIFLDDSSEEHTNLAHLPTKSRSEEIPEARVINRNIFGMRRKNKVSAEEPVESIQTEVITPTAQTFDNQTIDLLVNPNYLFRQCCEQRHLPDTCLSKCNYNAYTKDALQSMYFKTDGCPLEAAADMHFCAAQGRDHRQCCIRNGVTTTLAGEKCLTFCDQTPDKITHLDYSYVPCYDRFENMKRCFFSEIKFRAEKQFGKFRA
ncbi:unnamed protein product, partial [Mesorhabditis belari]|uniref:Domain of unknown function DB domain-containing protein n=1 Tax=Mesorhabditis belari TaxID=2138241 RepID=A0AAF3EAE3_9BILA